MKNIFKLSFLSLLFLTIMSCSDDDNKTVPSANSAPVLISPQDGTAVVLTEGLEANTALTLVWNHGDYDVATEIGYDVQFALAGTDFANPVSAGTTTARVYSMTVGELNAFATAEDKLNLPAFEAANLEVRVISSLGIHDEMPMVSNTLAITVTPFEVVVVEEPKLFFVGAPQAYYGLNAWDNTTAMPMRYIGDGTTKVFEAYVKATAGDGFKFIGQQGSWDNGNYGTIGGAQDGNLENAGGSADIKLAETDGPGLYYVQVDIDNLTYKAIKMSWGIIGDATPGAWTDETPMNYDFATNKWTLTADLTAAGLKYRSGNTGQFIYNDAWKFNVGNSDPKVTYNAAAPNFTITAAGSHSLELTINFDGTAVTAGE
jgi:hypothetical protein